MCLHRFYFYLIEMPTHRCLLGYQNFSDGWITKVCWGSAVHVKVNCKFCSYSQSIRLRRSRTKFATLSFLSVLFRSHIDTSLNSFAMPIVNVQALQASLQFKQNQTVTIVEVVSSFSAIIIDIIGQRFSRALIGYSESGYPVLFTNSSAAPPSERKLSRINLFQLTCS